MTNVLSILELLKIAYLLKTVAISENYIIKDDGTYNIFYFTTEDAIKHAKRIEVFIEHITKTDFDEYCLHFRHEGKHCELILR